MTQLVIWVILYSEKPNSNSNALLILVCQLGLKWKTWQIRWKCTETPFCQTFTIMNKKRKEKIFNTFVFLIELNLVTGVLSFIWPFTFTLQCAYQISYFFIKGCYVWSISFRKTLISINTFRLDDECSCFETIYFIKSKTNMLHLTPLGHSWKRSRIIKNHLWFLKQLFCDFKRLGHLQRTNLVEQKDELNDRFTSSAACCRTFLVFEET
jgi:hypothetical protein